MTISAYVRVGGERGGGGAVAALKVGGRAVCVVAVAVMAVLSGLSHCWLLALVGFSNLSAADPCEAGSYEVLEIAEVFDLS